MAYAFSSFDELGAGSVTANQGYIMSHGNSLIFISGLYKQTTHTNDT